MRNCVRQIEEYFERLDWLGQQGITHINRIIGLMISEFPELDRPGTLEVIRLYRKE